MKLDSLLNLARLKPAEQYHASVFRTVDGRFEQVASCRFLAGDVPALPLQNGDYINVYSAATANSCTIEGHVLTPSKIMLTRSARISDILINNVHFRNGAALDYAELLREGGNSQFYAVTSFSPGDIMSDNRVPDLILQPGDRLIFFPEKLLRDNQIVAMAEAENFPQRFPFKNGMKVSDLLKKRTIAVLPDRV
jgi:hypothetical protein